MISAPIEQSVKGLNPAIWAKVNLNLLTKIIAELMHEDVLHPAVVSEAEDGKINFRLTTDDETIHYSFSGYRRKLSYVHIDKASIKKYSKDSEDSTLDAVALLLELQQLLKTDDFTMAHYVEEVLHTLYADAYMHSIGKPGAATIVDSDFHTVERYMEGHPWYIINKGRIGFNFPEYATYAPEAFGQVNLLWIAVHKDRSYFEWTEAKSFAEFIAKELEPELIAQFREQLEQRGLQAADYYFMPINEWQWNNKIVFLFANDIAGQYLVPLHLSADQYSPQQSIRTYYNLSHPEKHFVKTTMSILNTSYIRGLSPVQLKIAPMLTTWLKDMVNNDPYLQHRGIFLLGEEATIGYFHPYFNAIKNPPYYYNEFLSVLWRESPDKYLRPGERLCTMASLLHMDEEQKSVVGAFIEKSGLSPEAWLKAYLEAYLCPVLHIYYQHSICVNPHGENTILVMKDYVPVRIALKDFIGDVLLNEEAQQKLPKEFAENLILSSNPENVPLVVLIGIFDGFFRYLSNIFHTYLQFGEEDFWRCVYEIVMAYRESHPELKDKFEKYNLFTPTFKRLNLNSQRLFKGYKETTGFEKAEKKGALENPLFQYAEVNALVHE